MTVLQPGQLLGAYRIIEQVGKGGMATVYKAYHAAMDRYVAVKILPYEFSEQAEFLIRFQREVRVIAKLEHPHILPVYDSGEHEGRPFLVMRYMDTGTLKERIEAGALSLADIDQVFTQLSEALGYAHQNDVIHRDLKPSNVLLTDNNDVFLADFGIARLVEDTMQMTATGAITGTPAYMSPEQAQGEKLDARSDMYSLGIVLYEMVTERVPYEAETPLAVILKHIQAPLPLPSTVKPDIHPEMERVILKALAKDRDERFNETAEFATAWQGAMYLVQSRKTAPGATALSPPSPPTLDAPPLTETAVSPAPCKRLPIQRIGRIAVALLLLVLVVFAILQFSRREVPEDSPDTADVDEQPADQPAADSPAVPVAAPLPTWTSWTGANQAPNLQIHQGLLYASGPGGVTIWDLSDDSYTQLTTQEGLPENYVNDHFADDDGILWIGTLDGLARFDEMGETIYDTVDGLDSSTITAIGKYGDSTVAGTIYGADYGGLNILDAGGWRLAPPLPPPVEPQDEYHNHITTFLEDPERGLWVGTEHNGLLLFDGESWQQYTTADGLPHDDITALQLDLSGNLLVGTYHGATVLDSGTFHLYEPTWETTIEGIVPDDDGRLWFSGHGGIWRYDPVRVDWETFSRDDGDIPVYTTYDAVKDDDGNLYFGTGDRGILRYDGSSFTSLHIPNVPTQAGTSYILLAPDGQLWFHEQYGSLNDSFDIKTGIWTRQENIYGHIAFDPNGVLWAGSDEGVTIRYPRNSLVFTSEDGLPHDIVRAIAFDEYGRAWVGTEGGIALVENDAILDVFDTANSGLADDKVYGIFTASDGGMWVATESGLSHQTLAGEWSQFGINDPFSDHFEHVTDVAEAADGSIWIVTDCDSVYRYAAGDWQHYDSYEAGIGLPSSCVNAVAIGEEGDVWFGTEDGAAHFDGTSWRSFDIADGLIDSYIRDIFIDETGAVWFATRRGITRYMP